MEKVKDQKRNQDSRIEQMIQDDLDNQGDLKNQGEKVRRQNKKGGVKRLRREGNWLNMI